MRSFEDLEGFEGKIKYPHVEGSKIISKANFQKEMGSVINLISDMTIKGASDEELVRAVKYLMVIVDSFEHKLDYERSAKDFRIKELKEKYQLREEVDENGVVHKHISSVKVGRGKESERKPLIFDRTRMECVCPRCERITDAPWDDSESPFYCRYCGQKITFPEK